MSTYMIMLIKIKHNRCSMSQNTADASFPSTNIGPKLDNVGFAVAHLSSDTKLK